MSKYIHRIIKNHSGTMFMDKPSAQNCNGVGTAHEGNVVLTLLDATNLHSM